MTQCVLCQKDMEPGDSVFDGHPVCRPCYEAEGRRSMVEDALPGQTRTVLGQQCQLYSRPPKYMLRPEEWARFGYK